jgi:ATP-binding cassette subfamily B protein
MKNSQLHAMFRLIRYAKPYRRDIILATIYSFINTVFYILPEILIGLAVDIVVYRHGSIFARLGITDVFHQLITLGVITFCVWIMLSLFEYLYSVKWRSLAQAIQHQLRLEVYTHVQGADMLYFENISNGKLAGIMNDDINQLERSTLSPRRSLWVPFSSFSRLKSLY